MLDDPTKRVSWLRTVKQQGTRWWFGVPISVAVAMFCASCGGGSASSSGTGASAAFTATAHPAHYPCFFNAQTASSIAGFSVGTGFANSVGSGSNCIYASTSEHDDSRPYGVEISTTPAPILPAASFGQRTVCALEWNETTFAQHPPWQVTKVKGGCIVWPTAEGDGSGVAALNEGNQHIEVQVFDQPENGSHDAYWHTQQAERAAHAIATALQ